MTRQVITIRINNEEVTAAVEPRMTLADFIREVAQLTGTHVGCEHGVCGACTVRLSGRTVRSCLIFAVQCDGQEVETIESVAEGPAADLGAAFLRHNALQCGFCTPGILITADELLAANPDPSREDVREHLSGNYCRCSGYQSIVDAVIAVAVERRRT